MQVVPLAREFASHLVVARWGIRLAVRARRAVETLEFRVSFESGTTGGWRSGESLAALEFTGPDYVVVIGGPDNEELTRRIRSGSLPPAWLPSFPYDVALDYGVTAWMREPPPLLALPRDLTGLGWRFPRLGEGESCELTAVVAVARDESASSAAWFAVDVAYEELLGSADGEQGPGEGAGPVDSEH